MFVKIVGDFKGTFWCLLNTVLLILPSIKSLADQWLVDWFVLFIGALPTSTAH